MIEHTDYRLALILPSSRQLLGIPSPVATELPVVRISLWERPAEQLTIQIEARWKIRTIVLDILVDPGFDIPCAVAEVRTDSWDFENEGFCVTQPDKICDTSLRDSQRSSLEAILLGNDTNGSVFSRIGWIDDAQRWIQSTLHEREVIFTGELRQLNGGGAFCLLRLGTQEGPAYWIKGVGKPNTHEFAVTNYLARHCPEYLPPVVAMRGDWNAWVMEEFGSSLHNSDSLDDFERAVSQLTYLQKRLTGRTEELLAAQCMDHRIGTLSSHIDEIIEYLDGAMRLQASTKVSPLTTIRLREIRNLLHDACSTLQELCIPDSLMHNDISPGSILCDGTQCVFTDWCEAYVGNPFITLEQFCVHVARKTDEPEAWVRRLKRVCKSRWIDVLTERQIDKAMRVAPLISVLSYLYGRGEWLHTPRRDEESCLSFSRSLARHMDRIARGSDLQEATCQPR